MTVERNKLLSRRFLEEVWNQGNLDRMDDFLSSEAVLHDPVSGETLGTAGVREFISMYRTAFPDLRFSIDEQIAEDDRVVTRWTTSGTHEAELMGIEPTGKLTTTPGITVDRFVDGKIRESWAQWDALGLMQQLGVIPELEQMA